MTCWGRDYDSLVLDPNQVRRRTTPLTWHDVAAKALLPCVSEALCVASHLGRSQVRRFLLMQGCRARADSDDDCCYFVGLPCNM